MLGEGIVAELEMSGEIESAIVAHLNNSGDEHTELVVEVEILGLPWKVERHPSGRGCLGSGDEYNRSSCRP